MKTVEVFSPATIANVGPGFDCFGLALTAPGDVITAQLSDKPGVRIVDVMGDGGRLPRTAQKNVAGVAAIKLLEYYPDLAVETGIELTVKKGMGSGTGLGSSAASAVGGAVAAMHVLMAAGAEWNDVAVFEAAMAGETLASGSRHADNVAPALYGGFTVAQDAEAAGIAKMAFDLDLQLAIVTPDIFISTKQSREVLPMRVRLADAKRNWANTAAIVAAITQGNTDLFFRALSDAVVEPQRGQLIPGYKEAILEARNAGAQGCILSGSGPTIAAFCQTTEEAASAKEALVRVFDAKGLSSSSWISQVSPKGAYIQ